MCYSLKKEVRVQKKGLRLMQKFILFLGILCQTLILPTGVSASPAEDYAELDRLALAAGTDKSSAWHNYTEIYAKYFAPLRHQPIKFLEIGIYKGDSVKLWENYFSTAKLHFIDINPSIIEYTSSRSRYHFVDQSNPSQLKDFAQSIEGNFDIIIDDGGHTTEQQLTSFKALFPYLKSGGMYIIEDLHCSYHLPYAEHNSLDCPEAGYKTTVTFLQRLIHDLNYIGATTHCADTRKAPEAFKQTLNEYQTSIYAIHFYTSLCIIIKR